MSGITKKIEVVANACIILTAAVLVFVLLQVFVFRQTSLPEIPAGTQIAVQDVQWEESRQTLLLALSVDCHFCTESAPFYQRLMQETAQRPDVHVIALLPQALGEAQQYLESLSVPVTDVRQMPLADLNVAGTPTLILVDNRGQVVDSWVGKLPADQEREVLAKLQ